MKYRIDSVELLKDLIQEKTFLLKQNIKKDLIIQDLKTKLNTYEGSNV